MLTWRHDVIIARARPLWQMDAMFPLCFKWRARVEMWVQDKVQDFLNPGGEIKAAHFSEAFNGSEECIFPMRMTFVTFAFMFFWRVPTYSQWYMSDAGQAKLVRAYKYYAQVLDMRVRLLRLSGCYAWLIAWLLHVSGCYAAQS